jgi:hypothetical protein
LRKYFVWALCSVASFTILFSDRVRSETGMREPSGIATTAPSFLDEGLEPVPEFQPGDGKNNSANRSLR